MNIQNIHQFNNDIEKTISIGKRIKDRYNKSRKSLRDNSGLKSTFTNELYDDDGGVVRTRKEDSSDNHSKIKRT